MKEKFEIYTPKTGKLGTVSSWSLACFIARLASLAGTSSVVMVDAGGPSLVADFAAGRLAHLWAGAPSKPPLLP